MEGLQNIGLVTIQPRVLDCIEELSNRWMYGFKMIQHRKRFFAIPQLRVQHPDDVALLPDEGDSAISERVDQPLCFVGRTTECQSDEFG